MRCFLTGCMAGLLGASALIAAELNLPTIVPATIQTRAWTSPVYYLP